MTATHVKDLGWLDSWSSCFSYLVRQNSKHPLSPVAPHSTFTITCTANHNTSLSRHWHTSCQLANQNRCSAFQYHINTHSANQIFVSNTTCTALLATSQSAVQSIEDLFCSLCYHRLHTHSQPYNHCVPCVTIAYTITANRTFILFLVLPPPTQTVQTNDSNNSTILTATDNASLLNKICLKERFKYVSGSVGV